MSSKNQGQVKPRADWRERTKEKKKKRALLVWEQLSTFEPEIDGIAVSIEVMHGCM